MQRLGEIHLQYLSVFLSKDGELKRADLNLIGRDCEQLDRNMHELLTQIQSRLPENLRPTMTPLLELWSNWKEASQWLWLQKCTVEKAKRVSQRTRKVLPASCDKLS